MGLETVVQLGLGIAQMDAQRKAANKQAEASRVQQRAQARSALRQAQIQRSRMTTVGHTLGATTTNTVGAQYGRNVGDAGLVSNINRDITGLQAQSSALGLFGKIFSSIDFSDMFKGASKP